MIVNPFLQTSLNNNNLHSSKHSNFQSGLSLNGNGNYLMNKVPIINQDYFFATKNLSNFSSNSNINLNTVTNPFIQPSKRLGNKFNPFISSNTNYFFNQNHSHIANFNSNQILHNNYSINNLTTNSAINNENLFVLANNRAKISYNNIKIEPTNTLSEDVKRVYEKVAKEHPETCEKFEKKLLIPKHKANDEKFKLLKINKLKINHNTKSVSSVKRIDIDEKQTFVDKHSIFILI